MKKTNICIKHTKHFWERVEERKIDLSALIPTYSKLGQAKIGERVAGANQNSTIVAERISASTAVLITGYKTKTKNT